ncbi:MAG: aminotransferase [Hyphomicrobiales bacterium]|nr:aminotransferase [Hyphomicrobiales bacterium]MCP5371528.1 aminotransferase [Hyphomicrobiales bacterium]
MVTPNGILSEYGTTIFSVMSALAVEHGAINLGQGFPDQDGPEDLRRLAAEAIIAGPNQYPLMPGVAELRQAVAAHNRRFYGLEVDWQTEVMVASGATEVLAGAFLGLLDPGDEVVMIEPLYDSYLPMVRRAGGVPRLVRLAPPHWTLPRDELAAAFSPRTKMLLLNSPHNPAGKVFDADDLAFLADLVVRHDAVAVCDEVYEHLVFDGRAHRPLMTFPGMRGRCVRIGSAGKTFSMTGWKVGYATGAPDLIAALCKAHQFTTFTTVPALQLAVAAGLGKEDAYFDTLAAEQQAKRDRLAASLARAGFDVLPTAGTYFLTAGFRPLGFDGDDVAFCRHMTIDAGVTAMPVSAFFQGGAVRDYVRFCFCKRDQVLDAAGERLERFFKG